MIENIRNITINAPVEKVFAFFDPMNLTKLISAVKEIKDVKGSGVGSVFRWDYEMVGRQFKGEATVTSYSINKNIQIQFKGGIHGSLTLTFERDEGGTRITSHSKYTVPVQLGGKTAENLVKSIQEKAMELNINTINARLEG